MMYSKKGKRDFVGDLVCFLQVPSSSDKLLAFKTDMDNFDQFNENFERAN